MLFFCSWSYLLESGHLLNRNKQYAMTPPLSKNDYAWENKMILTKLLFVCSSTEYGCGEVGQFVPAVWIESKWKVPTMIKKTNKNKNQMCMYIWSSEDYPSSKRNKIVYSGTDWLLILEFGPRLYTVSVGRFPHSLKW